MTTQPTQFKATHLVYVALLCMAVGFAWFYVGDRIVTEYIQPSWEGWFGTPWYKSSSWISIPAFALFVFGPIFSLLAMAWVLIHRFERINFGSIHNANLSNLTQAKSALEKSLESIVLIEKEYREKVAAHQSIQTQLDELKAVRDIDVETLQKKLNAIAFATRRSQHLQTLIGFVLGVLSSLVASWIWTQVNAS